MKSLRWLDEDRSWWVAIFLSCVAFVILMFAVFMRNQGNIFVGLDGSYMLAVLRDQATWISGVFGFGMNPLQGLGDIWIPLNERLFAGYQLPILMLGVDAAYSGPFQAVAYAIFASELFLATLIAGRAFGFDRTTSLLAAWLAAIVLFPVFGGGLIYQMLGLVPHVGTGIAETLLLLATFCRLGQTTSYATNFALVLLMILIAAHMLLSMPLGVVICVPLLVSAALGLLAGSETRKEAIVKIVGAAIVGAVLVAAGFLTFMLGLYSYSATRFWVSDFGGGRATAYEVSIIFQTEFVGYTSVVLFVGALLGLLRAVFGDERRLGRLAVAILGLILLVFGFGALTFMFDFWRGPLTVYFEMVMVPIYAMFAAYFAVGLARRSLSHRGPSRLKLLASHPLVLSVCIGLGVWIAASSNPARNHPLPQTKTPLVAFLADAVQLVPGGAFRGRVAMFQAQAVDRNVKWIELHTLDNNRVAATGNDYHLIGMWTYGIPTLIEYNQIMSPAFYRAATRLFARSSDLQNRNVVVVRQAAVPALAALGFRYVMADAPQSPPLRLVMTEKTGPAETIYLYEIPAPNLGTWSPVETKKVASFDAALDLIASADESALTRSAVIVDNQNVQTEVPANLVAVEHSSVNLIPGGIAVEARSAGSSLLVLPFEFSHCLRIKQADGATARLVRVNAIETGLVFAGNVRAEIQYFNGPFRNADCRIRDASEFSRLLGR